MVPKDIWLFTLGLLMAGAVDAAIPPVAWPADEFRLAKVPLVVAPPQDPTSAKKEDVAELLDEVEQAIRAFREQGNPRRLGEAERLLNGDLSAEEVSRDQRWRYAFLQSQLAQSLHQFERAWHYLTEAERSIQQLEEPDRRRDATMQWLLAAYHLALVQGDYAVAQGHCAAMGELVASLYRQACQIYLRGLREQDPGALNELQALIANHLLGGDVALHWIAVSRADLADRFADDSALDAWRMALLLSPEDRYTRSRYCEAALSAEQFQRALSLSAAEADDEAMLLCRLMALHGLTSQASVDADLQADYLQLRAQVEQLFTEMARRGGIPASRHRARYLLEIEGRQREALKMAEEIWTEQREWPDQQLLLDARAAVGDER